MDTLTQEPEVQTQVPATSKQRVPLSVKIGYVLLAVLLLYAPLTARSQALTLDQLISLYQKAPLQIDDYLRSRNWQYAQRLSITTDSVVKSCWTCVGGNKIGQLFLLKETGSVYELTKYPRKIAYLTNDQRVYAAIRAKMLEYKMEPENTDMLSDRLRERFIGTNYLVAIEITEINGKPAFAFMLSKR